MREGRQLIGWGMASGAWEALQVPASARGALTADGKLTVSSATADIGTGTYTIMTQIAAELLGLPDRGRDVQARRFVAAEGAGRRRVVHRRLGRLGGQGRLRRGARDSCSELARKIDGSPLADAALDDVTFADGQIRSRTRPVAGRLASPRRCGTAELDVIEEEASAGPSPKQEQYARYTHSAVFAEVQVDEDLGTIHVTRVVSAVAAGRILNPKTARSQVLGGIVWGIGMALEEESVLDQPFGRFMNHNLADYHVPVNADVHDIEVIFVEEHDELVNPLGAKGLGEIGVVGVAAAIANAVFHATGKRIRNCRSRSTSCCETSVPEGKTTTAYIGQPVNRVDGPRQGDGRREVRGRAQHPESRLWLRRVQRSGQGKDHADRRGRGAQASGRAAGPDT